MIMAEESQEAVGSAFELEYVTSGVSLTTNDAIGIQVVNDSGVAENTRVVIYKNTGAGAVTVVDTGRVVVTPTWTWLMSLPVKDPGTYWLRIQTTSESLIPSASFERLDAAGISKTLESYRPGDFAVFSLSRKRLW
jgi:hypothetical protein